MPGPFAGQFRVTWTHQSWTPGNFGWVDGEPKMVPTIREAVTLAETVFGRGVISVSIYRGHADYHGWERIASRKRKAPIIFSKLGKKLMEASNGPA